MQKIKQYIKKHPKISIAVLVLLGALIGIITLSILSGDSNGVEITESSRSVETIAVSEYATGAIGFFAPTASGDSFVVRAESGGRVDQTNVASGQKVASGDILVRLDGGAQLGALTQAEGAYEAALSTAQQGGVSTESSENSLISEYRSSYTTANNTLLTTIDIFFSNPTTGQTPGVRIDGNLYTEFLNTERVALRSVMASWQEQTGSISANSDLISVSDSAINTLRRMIEIVDVFILIINKQDNNATLNGVDVRTYISNFSASRASLLASIDSLQTAQENLRKARLNSVGASSGSSAQIKQALGSLQSARSAYEKTIIRSPFAGVVSSLNVQVGDIVGTGSDIAVITPENNTDTEQSFNLPLSAVKYTPAGTYVFSVDENGVIHAVAVQAGLVTTSAVTVTGLTGNEIIVQDIRGLKDGDKVAI